MNSITTAINSAKTLEELRQNLPQLSTREQEIFGCAYMVNPLQFAVKSDFMQAVKFYITLGLDYEDFQEELLQLIINNYDFETCTELFQKCTNKKTLANYLLMISINYGSLEFVKIALKEGADKHITKTDHILSICAKEDMDAILEELLRENNFSQEALNRALSIAKNWSSIKCIELLKKYGALNSNCFVM